VYTPALDPHRHVVTPKPVITATNPPTALPVHTSPLDLAHAVKTPLSNMSDVPNPSSHAVKHAVVSFHADIIAATRHVINKDRGNVGIVLKCAVNPNESVDILVLPFVTRLQSVPKEIHAARSLIRNVLVGI
jgi:hypothetical protein